jgi:hypothetical protein
MNLKDLIDAARDDLDDTAAPYLFSKARLTRYANEAEREACRRSRLITDSTTPEICRLTVSAGNEIVTLDERVIYVKKAKLASCSVKLAKVTVLQADNEMPGWEDDEGEVVAWLPDYQSGAMRLYLIPTAADVLDLTVIRGPLGEMTQDTDTPEINVRYHEKLVHWMRYRAYLRKDVDTHDPKQAAEALALFEAEFGPATNAQNETFNHERYGQDDYEGNY